MNEIVKKISIIFIAIIILFSSPLIVSAQDEAKDTMPTLDSMGINPLGILKGAGKSDTGENNAVEGANEVDGGGGIVKCSGPKDCTLPEFFKTLENLTTTLIIIAFGFLAIVISYAGFLYLTAGGKEAQVKKAHEVLRMAIIGFMIILLAWVLLEVFYDIIGVKEGYNPFKEGELNLSL